MTSPELGHSLGLHCTPLGDRRCLVVSQCWCGVWCVGGAGGEMGWAHTAHSLAWPGLPVSVRSGCLRNVSLLSNIDINNAVNTNTANTAQQTVDKESTPVDNDNELYLAVLTWLYIYYVNCAVNQCCSESAQLTSPYIRTCSSQSVS